MTEHGALTNEPGYYARWCAVCQRYHGGLYQCPHYPHEVQADIQALMVHLRQLVSEGDLIVYLLP